MENQEKLLPFYSIVEEAIKLFNLNPKDAILPNQPDGQVIYALTKGRANVRIIVWINEETKVPYVRVVCPIVAIPEKYENYGMLNEFLELNSFYIGVKFVRSGNAILLGVDKEMIEVSPQELFAMMNRVLNVGANEIVRLEEKYSKSIQEHIEQLTPASQEA